MWADTEEKINYCVERKQHRSNTLITGDDLQVYINLTSSMIRASWEWSIIMDEKKNIYEREIYKQLSKLANPLDRAKSAGWKAAEKSSFPVYLHFITERMRYFAYLRRIHAHIHIHTYERMYYARSTAQSRLADHPHGYFTAASAVSPCRKVPNGEAGLKKGSGGANT